MAPKQQQIRVQPADRPRRVASRGYFGEAYSAITSPENASVVRSVAVFGAAVAFFSSSWSDFLLPAL
ncbi:hypothetical protein BJ875DRAFT_488807 [Amylocarpus encephaloides]|uniref:TOM core complex subunit Tom6 n=1 Tax=Amylocarpus encephaloides TaxID=45428 RepID=A0A9P7YAC9_9HELO|nr:hypothetical protein BJ875DRAFT_488807 [Amylocarpus encephaloides]